MTTITTNTTPSNLPTISTAAVVSSTEGPGAVSAPSTLPTDSFTVESLGTNASRSEAVLGRAGGRLRRSSTDSAVRKVKAELKQALRELAKDEAGFNVIMKDAFGIEGDKAASVLAAIKNDSFSISTEDGDTIELLPTILFSSIRGNAGNEVGIHGAYSSAQRTMYLDAGMARDPMSLMDVAKEELGHHFDAVFNVEDTQGDEGEMFRHLINGTQMSDEMKDRISEEHGQQMLKIDGQAQLVECGNEYRGGWGSELGNDIQAKIDDCVKNGKFDWTFTSGENLLKAIDEQVPNWVADSKSEKKSVAPCGYRWNSGMIKHTKYPRPTHGTVSLELPKEARNIQSSKSNPGYTELSAPSTTDHSHGRTLTSNYKQGSRHNTSVFTISANYERHNYDKIKMLNELEGKLIDFAEENLRRGRIEGVAEVFDNILLNPNRLERDPNITTRAMAFVKKVSGDTLATANYDQEDRSKRALTDILATKMAALKEASKTKTFLGQNLVHEIEAQLDNGSNKLFGRYRKSLNEDSDLLSFSQKTGDNESVLDLTKRLDDHSYKIYKRALDNRLALRFKKSNTIVGQDLEEVVQHRCLPKTVTNQHGQAMDYKSDWLTNVASPEVLSKVGDACIKDVLAHGLNLHAEALEGRLSDQDHLDIALAHGDFQLTEQGVGLFEAVMAGVAPFEADEIRRRMTEAVIARADVFMTKQDGVPAWLKSFAKIADFTAEHAYSTLMPVAEERFGAESEAYKHLRTTLNQKTVEAIEAGGQSEHAESMVSEWMRYGDLEYVDAASGLSLYDLMKKRGLETFTDELKEECFYVARERVYQDLKAAGAENLNMLRGRTAEGNLEALQNAARELYLRGATDERQAVYDKALETATNWAKHVKGTVSHSEKSGKVVGRSEDFIFDVVEGSELVSLDVETEGVLANMEQSRFVSVGRVRDGKVKVTVRNPFEDAMTVQIKAGFASTTIPSN